MIFLIIFSHFHSDKHLINSRFFFWISTIFEVDFFVVVPIDVSTSFSCCWRPLSAVVIGFEHVDVTRMKNISKTMKMLVDFTFIVLAIISDHNGFYHVNVNSPKPIFLFILSKLLRLSKRSWFFEWFLLNAKFEFRQGE